MYSTWLTVLEAAEYCRISESKMRKLIAKGELPINRIGGKILINRKALDYFVMFGTGKPTKRQREAYDHC
ncbi:MAG: helix-turn-helix domain-containing protein [Parcubacteria group bacterium]|nr:helix-turn-helix domain-containing protein [Parcubacteria group bacterium]